MNLTDKAIRKLCKDLRAQIKETPPHTNPIGYRRILAGLEELLKHRIIARMILRFAHDRKQGHLDAIIHETTQIHDKKLLSAKAKALETRIIQEAISRWNAAALQAEQFRAKIYSTTDADVDERRRQ